MCCDCRFSQSRYQVACEFGEVAPGLFELILEKPPMLTPMEAVSAKIGRADSTIREVSVGGLDLRTAAFIGDLLLALQQATRGNFSGPAIPMLLAALSLTNVNGGNTTGGE